MLRAYLPGGNDCTRSFYTISNLFNKLYKVHDKICFLNVETIVQVKKTVVKNKT